MDLRTSSAVAQFKNIGLLPHLTAISVRRAKNEQTGSGHDLNEKALADIEDACAWID
jgi:hypothetical protein